MSNLSVLSVADISVQQDLEGRYCLNDLHKAAGGEKRHAPGFWLENQQAVELINELLTTGIPVVKTEGRYGGTFVAKELVYAYAMWISPTFHVRVIRAYDALAMGDTAKAETIARPRATPAVRPTREFRDYYGIARLIGLDKNVAAIAANNAAIKLTGVNVLQIINQTHLAAENQESLVYTPSELGLRLGVSGQKFNKLLELAELQAKDGDHWVPTEKAKGQYRFLDTGKKHSAGAMIQQVKWHDTVLGLLEKKAA